MTLKDLLKARKSLSQPSNPT